LSKLAPSYGFKIEITERALFGWWNYSAVLALFFIIKLVTIYKKKGKVVLVLN
jgi:hypothetical protein